MNDLFHAALTRELCAAEKRMTAHGIPAATAVRDKGNHLAASNDEPEPGDLSEADLIEIDRQYAVRKDADALRAERELRALHEQMDRRPV
jgi:hypothetical protein